MPTDKLQEIRELMEEVDETQGSGFVLSALEALSTAMLLVVDEIASLKAKVEPPHATE